MIQIIPFNYGEQPDYLPLLSRGLADLAVLKFNTARVEAEINLALEIKECSHSLEPLAIDSAWEGQDLWFTGKIDFEGRNLQGVLLLIDPADDQLIYCDIYQTSEERFLLDWEEHFQKILNWLVADQVEQSREPLVYTQSLEAFLEFRRGLEILAQAKRQEQREKGLEHLLTAVAYDSNFVEAIDFLLIYLSQNLGSYNIDYALGMLERLNGYAVNHPRVSLVLSELYHHSGNQAKSETILQEVVENFPDFDEAWIRLALLYQYQGESQTALDVLEKHLENQHEDVTSLDLAGAIYASQGRHQEAGSVWQRALQLDPLRVNVLNNLGLLAEETGNAEKAEAYYLKAIKLNDRWWGSFYNLGSFCSRSGRLKEGESFLEKAVVLNPYHSPTFIILAETQIKLGRYNKAQEALLKSLQLSSDNTIRCQALEMLERLNDVGVRLEMILEKLDQYRQEGKRFAVFCWLLKYYLKGRTLANYWYLWSLIWEDWNLGYLSVLALKLGLRHKPGYKLLKKLGLYYYGKGNYKVALPWLQATFRLHNNDPEISSPYFEVLLAVGEVAKYQELTERFSRLEAFAEGNSLLRSN